MGQMIISRTIAAWLCRLFDYMYRLGVNDAFHSGDEGQILEWIEKTSQVGVFGRLDDQTSDTPLYWQLTIMKETHTIGLYNNYNMYCRRMGRFGNNYLSVMLVLCQCFYNMGMREWAENPKACDLAVFNARYRVRWAPGSGSWNTDRIVCMAQEFCFRMQYRDNNSDNRLALKKRHYDTFLMSIGMATRHE